jgi:TyrR family helix-turn-helix protein
MDEQGDISFVLVNERDMTELRALREEIENSRMKVDKFQEELKKINDLEHEQYGIIAESHSMLSVLQTCRKLAQLEVSNILIRGESGTGKGMIAQYVHQNSKRSEKPFIQVNCAAIPETLMEAELFGYEKGAFTGARLQGKAGLIELAHGGTLFLDEIGDMPLQLQAKLLKYLDDKQFRRVGGVKLHEVDCILLTATNRDLEKLSAKKKFRKDLFYRLSSFPIKLPSLNERPEDIPPLAAHFIEQFNQKYNLKRKATPSALLQLQTHHYHGNARELRNMVKKAVILNETDLIDNIIKFNEPGKESSGFSEVAETISGQLTLKERLRAVEKDIFVEMLKKRPTTRQIAQALGIDHSTVVRKLKTHGLSTLAGVK